jgi:hypothetical protein
MRKFIPEHRQAEEPATREERLSAALRQNLRRRKAQIMGREARASREDIETESMDGEPSDTLT